MLMDRVWLQSYPPGVPAEIDPSQLRSLKELIEKTCSEHADRVAFIQMGAQLTYRELDELSRAFAAWLQRGDSGRVIAWRSCCPIRCSTRSQCSAPCAPA
jgi:non-ribosomal peptide synthetase component F